MDNTPQFKGLRYNTDKLPMRLMPSYALEQMNKVMAFGAKKYEPWNWAEGMSWTTVLDSLERHLKAFKECEDYDIESGELHAAHMMTNAAYLVQYSKIFPMGDDRRRACATKRIGLDVDDVCADFVGEYIKKFNLKRPVWWNFDPNFAEHYKKIANNKDFWMNMPVIIKPEELTFEPTVFITSRKCPNEWTSEWLYNAGFNVAPVVQSSNKIEIYKEHNLDAFVDDRYDNYVNIVKGGGVCYLFERSHNTRYNVGMYRIKTTEQINRLAYDK